METAISVISTIIVAIATVALVVLTGKYVRLTKAMVDEMKEAREPDVHVDFELPERMLRLVVGNSGRSPARNIKFEILSDIDCIRAIHRPNATGLTGMSVFENGVSYLSPGRKLKYWTGYLEPKKEAITNKVFRIIVRYENDAKKRFERDISIDMGQYEHVLFESFKDGNVAVADAIRDSERSRRFHDDRNGMHRLFKFSVVCPFCCEEVKNNAKKCPHCGEWIKKDQESQPEVVPDKEPAVDDSPSVG